MAVSMIPWLHLVAILHAPPLPMQHSGVYFQRPVVDFWADRLLLPRWYAMKLTQVESSFRIRLETKAWVGKRHHQHRIVLSHGLLQTNPRYEAEFAAAVGLAHFDWRQPDQSARVGLGRLAWLVRYFHGDLMLAAASYNAGIRRIESVRPLPDETMTYLRRIVG